MLLKKFFAIYANQGGELKFIHSAMKKRKRASTEIKEKVLSSSYLHSVHVKKFLFQRETLILLFLDETLATF